jgi:bifunctional non-homologous end joining protein LigD
MGKIRMGRYSITTSKTDKILFPDDDITKGELINYYRRISDVILPHLKQRPLSLERFPDGIHKSGFFQKQIGDYFPDWIDRVKIPTSADSKTQIVCNKAATLVYLANQACITPHTWLSRSDSLKKPDRLIFDFDPSGDGFDKVRKAALLMAELLDDLGLRVYAQVTGSEGVHLVVPLMEKHSYDAVRNFALDAASYLERDHSGLVTTEQRKAKRGDRVFIDTLRNAYGQTAVAPYAVRARKRAPVAAPIELEELAKSSLEPDKYTIKSIFRRLSHRNDPWRAIDRHKQSLERAAKQLRALCSDRRSSFAGA